MCSRCDPCGDDLYGFENDDGTFVALKPIVESMGMDWNGQYQRVKRDPILSEGMCVMHIPFGRGGNQDAVCLKLDLVNGWLFTIDTSPSLSPWFTFTS
ncbi:phage antirepressor N-terminal domain-containing protein [Rhizobium sp. 21-4511-3d]